MFFTASPWTTCVNDGVSQRKRKDNSQAKKCKLCKTFVETLDSLDALIKTNTCSSILQKLGKKYILGECLDYVPWVDTPQETKQICDKYKA